MPAEVSTCGANTTLGRCLPMAATTSSSGAGANGARVPPSPTCRAFNTCAEAGMFPISMIWVQRKLNQPLRMMRQSWPVANWRATASMPKVPLPGSTIAALA